MAKLKRSEIRTIEEAMAYPNGFGYVLDFSDRTMEEFFEDEFSIQIYDKKYSINGTSKRNHLTAFIQIEDESRVIKVLRALWELREGLIASNKDQSEAEEASKISAKFLKIIANLESNPSLISTEGVDTYKSDRTLEELVSDIERTLAANKPEVAIDHLHTYCVKKITHLLEIRGIICTNDEPLQSRFGKYRKVLIQEKNLHEFTDRAMKASISLLDSFNDLRNNRSLAHDNEILGPIEARFVVSSMCAILVLIRAVEAKRYGE